MLKTSIRRHLQRLYHTMGANVLTLIVLGFAGIILVGSLILSMPFASRSGESIGWYDALFTSTSAVCVTGLVVRDTATTFNLFGQIVIMCLIEVGGLGFMTFATLVFRLIGRQISLRERMLIRESMNESGVGGMDRLIYWVALSAFTVQLAGALVLSLRFVPMYGLARGAFYSLFHSVSAFCNAGFDLFGNFSSLTAFRGDWVINICVILLIVIGGLGFAVLRDLRDRCGKRRYLHLHTRLVLISFGFFLLFGWIFVLLAEWNNPQTLGPLNFWEKLLAALFQSVTLRTAGFNTIDQQALRPATKLISSMLMFIGASPASTGGGVKVTTVAVIFLAVRMTVKGNHSIVVFRRKIPEDLLRRALSVVIIAAGVVLVDVVAISLMQPELSFLDILMECSSAMGTVGISAFGSYNLSGVSRLLIILTMYLGRIGPLTMALVLAHRQRREPRIQYPNGQIMIG